MKIMLFVSMLLFISCTPSISDEKESEKDSKELKVFIDTIDGVICKQFMDSEQQFQKFRLFYDMSGNLKIVHYIKDNELIGISDFFDTKRKIIERRKIRSVKGSVKGELYTEQTIVYNDDNTVNFDSSNFIDYSMNGNNYKLLNESKIGTNIFCAIGNYSYDSIQVIIFKKTILKSNLIPIDTFIKHTPEFYFEFDFKEKIKDNFEVVLRISTIKHWDDHPGKIGFIDYNINLMEERIAKYPNKYEAFDYWNLE